jgi:hypothetical protein
MYRAEDLDTFLGDFAVDVVFGDLTAKGILDVPSELERLQLGSVGKGESALLIKATDFDGLKVGSALTVDGVSYTVRELTTEDDGAFKRALLKKA